MRRLSALLMILGVMFLLNCGSSGSPTTTTTGGGGTGGGGGNGQTGLQSIKISPSSATIAMGTTQAFTATGTYSDGTTKDLTLTAQWGTPIPTLASVSNIAPTQGVATAIAPGTVLVTATSGSVSNSATLIINAATLDSLAITPIGPIVGYDNLQQFTATATFSDMTTQDVTNVSSWQAFPSFITSNSGLLIAQGLGLNTVFASFGGMFAAGPASPTVDFSNLVSVSVFPANSTIATHTKLAFSAIGTFNDGSTRDVTPIVSSWTSSSNSVGSFSFVGNKLSAGAPGTTMVSASLTDPTSGNVVATGSTNLTISSAQLVSIALSPANPSMAPGTKLNFTALGTFDDSSTQDITSQVIWSTATGSTSVSGGTVTALSTGPDTLTAASSGSLAPAQGSTGITVTAGVLQSLTVTPVSAFVTPGNSISFSTTGTFLDSTTNITSTQDITDSSTWKTSSPTVATVKSGVATAQGLGGATITATPSTLFGVTGLTTTSTLAVASPAQISLAVTPATVQISNGTTAQLTATATLPDGTTQDFTSFVQWSSSAPTTATVGYQTGVVTALASGNATITATVGSVSASAAVTVQ